MLNIPKATDKSFADGKILQSVTDGVGVITFNNPEKRNAMSLDMWEGLGHALVELRDDAEVRVVVLVGAGDKAFMPAGQISDFLVQPPLQKYSVSRFAQIKSISAVPSHRGAARDRHGRGAGCGGRRRRQRRERLLADGEVVWS
jgi:enoyl-CoA hydratase/carnithine racemase